MSKIWTAGPDESCRIGRDKVDSEPHPIQIPTNDFITGVALGWKHGMFITNSNSFFSWGSNCWWCLATGTTQDRPVPDLVSTFPPGFQFAQIVSGDKYCAALSQNGELYMWGGGYSNKPALKPLPGPVAFLAGGQVSLIAALKDGRVVTITRKKDPVIIQIQDEKIIEVAAGTNLYIALSESGHAYTWGIPPQTGLPRAFTEPQRVLDTSDDSIIISHVYAYHQNAWFVDTKGTVYCCGQNSFGSLGLDSAMPQRHIIPHPTLSHVQQIACGDDFTIALTQDGSVYACGNGADGRNVTGVEGRSTAFVKSPYFNGLNVTQVAAGCSTSAFLIDGAPPYGTDTTPASFTDIVMLTCDRDLVFDDTSHAVVSPNGIEGLGLELGDVIKMVGDRGCVIGITDGHPVVCLESTRKISRLPETAFSDIVMKYELESRTGVALEEGLTESGFVIRMDSRPEVLIDFGGIRKGDKLSDGRVIAGARGKLLFARKGDTVSICENPKIVERDGKPVTSKLFVDGKHYVMDLEADDRLYCSGVYGAGQRIGVLTGKPVYSFACHYGCCTYDVEDEIRPVRNAGVVRMQSNKGMVDVDTAAAGPVWPYDLVETPHGLAVAVGRVGDQYAVLPERNFNLFGVVFLYKKIRAIGRIGGPLEIDGVSVNANDLWQHKCMPGDIFEKKGKRKRVVGLKDNAVVYADAGTGTRNRIVERHMCAQCLIPFGGTSIGISVWDNATSVVKVGAQYTDAARNTVVFIGRNSNGYFFELPDGQISRIDLRKIRLPE